MERKLLILYIALMSLISSFTFAKEVQAPQQSLPSLQLVLELGASLGRVSWSLVFEFDERKKDTKTATQVIADIDSFIGCPPASDEAQSVITRYNMIAAYRDNLDSLFTSLTLIGNNFAEFLYLDSSLPISIAQLDNGTVVIITSVASDMIYNTLRSTARVRAAKVVESMILPSLPKLRRAFESTKVQYVGMMVIFGSKDFSNESSALDLEPEAVALIVDMKHCGQFADCKITDVELVGFASIYMRDRDTVAGIKKIGIVLE